MTSRIDNRPVKGISYFTPAHDVTPGAPINISADTPTLFTPLKIRSTTLRNRIIVAPMCQYSAAPSGPSIGALTDYHVATLGHYALKGAAVVFIEATGVQPNGRITPNCPGLWEDAQIAGVKRVCEIVKSQGALCAIQLAHAGRKSSTVPPWIATKQKRGNGKGRAPAAVHGWPDNVVGPTGGEQQTWDGKGSGPEGSFYPPREMTEEDIQDLVGDFAAATTRSITAGVDLIEIHAAHGYLLHQFLSPITNRRTDKYGGSFENRTRLLIEVLQAVRKVMPDTMPLFLRLSATEWMEKNDLGQKLGSWDIESTIRLSKMLPDLGVDLLDVSSGGNHPQQAINLFDSNNDQITIASRIRQAVRQDKKNLLIGAVGLITEAEQARSIVETGTDVRPSSDSMVSNDSIKEEAKVAERMTDSKAGKEPLADVILVARQFMREPEWVLKVAWRLGTDVAWPSQFLRVRFPKL